MFGQFGSRLQCAGNRKIIKLVSFVDRASLLCSTPQKADLRAPWTQCTSARCGCQQRLLTRVLQNPISDVANGSDDLPTNSHWSLHLQLCRFVDTFRKGKAEHRSQCLRERRRRNPCNDEVLSVRSQPRGDVEKYGPGLVTKGKITQKQLDRLRRQEGAHANAVEHLPFFLAAMLLAHYAKLPNSMINKFCLAYVAARLTHSYAYLNIETPGLSYIRSLAWWAGNITVSDCLTVRKQ